MANSGVHALTDDKLMKSWFSKNGIAILKTSKVLKNILFWGSVEYVQMCWCNVPIQWWLISYY